MILHEVATSFVQRFLKPSTWGIILGFGLVWVAARLISGVPLMHMGAWEFLVPSLFLMGHLALSAVPWQWTGNSQPKASWWRGSLQSLPWNSAWVFLMLWSVNGLVDPNEPAWNIRHLGDPGQKGSFQHQIEKTPRGLPPSLPPGGPALPFPHPPPPPGLHHEMMLLFLNLPFAMVLGWFLSEKEHVESRERILQSLAQEARRVTLQSQVHPHALYNTLSGITELVQEDPDAAEEAMVELTELLRMLARQASAPELPLAQERLLVRHYLRIEKIRLGARLTVVWDWPEWADALVTPPLLLQPLVENAIKHGIAVCLTGGTLKISASKSENELLLRVANSGHPLEGIPGKGIGIQNLQERLSLMARYSPSFQLRSDDGWTLAELRMKIPVNALL